MAGCSGRHCRWRRQGLPSSRGNPCVIRPVLRPRRDRQAKWTMSVVAGAAPASDKDEGSHEEISGLNRTAFELAVYASQGRSPTHHARLASGCWPSSTGRDWLPAGFPTKGFKLGYPPFPSFLCNVSSSFLPEKTNRHRITHKKMNRHRITPRRGHRASPACHRETTQSCEGQRFDSVTNRVHLTCTPGSVGDLGGRPPRSTRPKEIGHGGGPRPTMMSTMSTL